MKETGSLEHGGRTKMAEGPYKLPKGWRWVRLGDVLSECIGGTWGTGDDPNGVGVLRPNNIGQDGTIIWQDIRWRKVPISQLKKRKLQSGDIILTKSNSLEQVGRAALFEEPNDGHTYVPSNCNCFGLIALQYCPNTCITYLERINTSHLCAK